jgi:hypothetical protein
MPSGITFRTDTKHADAAHPLTERGYHGAAIRSFSRWMDRATGTGEPDRDAADWMIAQCSLSSRQARRHSLFKPPAHRRKLFMDQQFGPCPRCQGQMRRVRTVPKLGLHPELAVYRCRKCGGVEMAEPEPPKSAPQTGPLLLATGWQPKVGRATQAYPRLALPNSRGSLSWHGRSQRTAALGGGQ